jgi:hypothetical protein
MVNTVFKLLTIGTDGTLHGTQQYFADPSTEVFPRFARDGSIFAAVRDFPSVRFVHIAANGTADAGFQSADVQVPNLPSGSSLLDTAAIETSDAWLITESVYLANATPDNELLLFRVWK